MHIKRLEIILWLRDSCCSFRQQLTTLCWEQLPDSGKQPFIFGVNAFVSDEEEDVRSKVVNLLMKSLGWWLAERVAAIP